MGAGAVWAGAPPRFSLVLVVIRKVMATIMIKMLRILEVTLPLQAREEQVESLLVLVVVVTTTLLIFVIIVIRYEHDDYDDGDSDETCTTSTCAPR